MKITPPTLARRWGISPDKVLGFIRAGELRAIDVSTHAGTGRPRFRIDEADILIFENRRSATPTPKPVRRRRKDPAVIEYF